MQNMISKIRNNQNKMDPEGNNRHMRTKKERILIE